MAAAGDVFRLSAKEGQFDIPTFRAEAVFPEVSPEEFASASRSTDCYCRLEGGRRVVLPQSLVYSDSGPSQLPHHVLDFPPENLCSIGSGLVLGPFGLVARSDGSILLDSVPNQMQELQGEKYHYGGEFLLQHLRWLRNAPPNPSSATWSHGAYRMLMTNGFAPTNYYHWLIDCLPQLNGLDIRYPEDCMGVPDPSIAGRFVEGTLRALGAPASRLVRLDGRLMSFDRIILRSRLPGALPAKTTFLRRAYDRYRWQAPSGRRLFLVRHAQLPRRIVNLDKLTPILKAFSIEIWDPSGHPFEEQVTIASQAELLIGAHGAGLANAVFMHQGGAVVEIGQPHTLADRNFRRLCATGDLRYSLIVGQIDPQQAVDDPNSHDIDVPPDALEAAIVAAIKP